MSITVSKTQVGVRIGNGALSIGDYGDAEGSCADMGASKGGIEVSVERKYLEMECDNEIGIIDIIKHAERFTLKIPMLEVGNDNLARAMDYPDSAVVSDLLSFGGDQDTNFKTLFLNIDKSNGGTRKIHLYKVVCINGGTHKYEKGVETIFDMEFLCIQDLTKTVKEQIGTSEDTGTDTTAPTIVLTTPAAGGTVTKDGKDTILLTWTEANLINENSISYGDTVNIYVTTGGTNTLVAGSIATDTVAKTITFTPTANWTASDTLMVNVTKGFEDNAGNGLATAYVANLSVTA